MAVLYTVTQTFHGVAPRSVLSWIPRRVRSGAADGMCCHRRLSGASRSALCFLCSPIQRLGSGSDFDDVAVTSEKKTHRLRMQMLVNGHSVALETLAAATTRKSTFHQVDVNLPRVLTPKCF